AADASQVATNNLRVLTARTEQRVRGTRRILVADARLTKIVSVDCAGGWRAEVDNRPAELRERRTVRACDRVTQAPAAQTQTGGRLADATRATGDGDFR